MSTPIFKETKWVKIIDPEHQRCPPVSKNGWLEYIPMFFRKSVAILEVKSDDYSIPVPGVIKE